MHIGELEAIQLLNQIAIGVHYLAVQGRVAGIWRHRREANANAVMTPDVDDRGGYFQRESCAILNRTTILIGSLIGRIAQELIEQIAIGRVHFNTIKAGAFCACGSVSVLLDNVWDLGCFQRSRHGDVHHSLFCEGLAFGFNRRGRYRCRTIGLQVHMREAPHMPQLANNKSTSGMHRICYQFPACYVLFSPDAWRQCIPPRLRANIGRFTNDQACAGTLCVVAGVHFVGYAFWPHAAAR